MVESNKQLVRRLYTEYLNPGRLDRLEEIVSPAFRGGPAAFAAPVSGLRTAMPDLTYTVEDVVGDGDRVAVRWTLRGTHTGQFRSFAATGKPITNTGFAMFELAGGKIVRSWIETDRLGFLQTIGAIPDDPAFGTRPPAK